MDKNSLLGNAKAHIADGNTDEALALVDTFLAAQPKYKLLHNESLHLASIFYKTKQDQAKRTINFEDAEISFGKVREGLINLLDSIETDNFNPPNLVSAKPSFLKALFANKWLLFLGLPLLVLTVAVLILVKNMGSSAAAEACEVEFENPTAKNFLIMPFYKPTGGEAQIEGLFTGRLEEFCAGIESLKNSSFRICDKFRPNILFSYEEAAKIGEQNGATIILWGLTEQSNGSNFVKTRFKYLGGKDKDGKVPFTRLSQAENVPLQGEQAVSTDKVLSIITSTGELTQNLESTLMLMFGMIANLEGDRKGAIAAMNAADVSKDSAANLMKYMILADNFIAMNETEKAKSALDTCLMVNKNYWLGRNNRANLRMESGNYIGAIDDLTVALKKQPEDVDMLVARGWAYKQSQQLYAAVKDFEQVVKIKPEAAPQLKQTLLETNLEIKRLERIVEPSKANIETKQLTKQQYLTAADASNKLGDITITKQLVTKGLALDKNDPKLLAIQIDNLLKEKDPRKARQVIKDAVNRKVKQEEIAKYSKNVAALIKEMNLAKELEIN